MKYANGKTKEFYQIGVSANTTGISPVYIMGIDDKNTQPRHLAGNSAKQASQGIALNSKH